MKPVRKYTFSLIESLNEANLFLLLLTNIALFSICPGLCIPNSGNPNLSLFSIYSIRTIETSCFIFQIFM